MERQEDSDEVPGEGVEEVASDGGIGPEIEAEGIPVDAQEARPIFDPRLPSQQEVDIHYLTYLPYRNWCPVCIKAKGKENPHLKQYGKIKVLPVVSLDYDSYGQDFDEEKPTAIIMKDESSGYVFTHACLRKGPSDNWMLNKISE